MNKTVFYVNIVSTVIHLLFLVFVVLLGVFCFFVFNSPFNYSAPTKYILLIIAFVYFSVMVPIPLLLTLFFPFKKIIITKNYVSFRVLFKTKKLCINDILNVSIEKYLYEHLDSKYGPLFEDCLYFQNVKFKKNERMDTSIPIKKIFCRSDKKTKERYEMIMSLITSMEGADIEVVNNLKKRYHERFCGK